MFDYSYWPPTQKQFFFPQSISFVDFIIDFYKPYKLKAKIGWFFFLHSKWIQNKFLISENEIPIPFGELKSVLSNYNIPFFYFLINLGTPGVEQKISIIIIDQNLEKIAVIKLAQNSVPKSLIENENRWLSKIASDSFNVPKLILYEKKSNFDILVLSYLEGMKLPYNPCSPKIIKIIKSIIALSKIEEKKDLQYTFAHGDFCPWNILVDSNNKYSLIDWEMAGEYPLGYDLFTFIFQTYFLVSARSPYQLLRKNQNIITEFFASYEIHDWEPYLKEFCFIKMSKKNIIEQKTLFNKYKKLHNLL